MVKNFTPREAYAAYILGSVLVDVRDNAGPDSKTLGVNRILSLPFSELDKRYGELPSNKPVILMSRVGNKGKEAATFLVQHGYNDVAIMDGGLDAWVEEGLPVK
jgi:rhodanese-related sulfurtransferase